MRLRSIQRVAHLVVRLFARELLHNLGIGPARAWTLTACLTASAGVMSVALALTVNNELAGGLPSAIHGQVLRTSFASAVMTTSLITTIFCLVAPNKTEISSLIEMLPIGRLEARLGQVLPTLGLAFAISLALSSPAISVLHSVRPEPVPFSIGTLCLLVIIATTEAFVLGLFAVTLEAGARVKMPPQLRPFLAGVVGISFGLCQAAPDILPLKPDLEHDFAWHDGLIFARIWAELLLNPIAGSAWTLVCIWILLAVAILTLSSRWGRGVGGPAALPIALGTRFPKARWSATVWLELLTAGRSPQTFLSVAALALGLGLASWLNTFDAAAPLVTALAGTLPIVPFAVALYGVGRTIACHWVGDQLTATRTWWVLPKAVAYASVGLALACVSFSVEVLLGLSTLTQLPDLAPRAALCLGASLLSGTLVTVTDSQPLSAAAASSLGAVVYLVSITAIGWLETLTEARLAPALTTVVAGGVFALYIAAALKPPANAVP